MHYTQHRATMHDVALYVEHCARRLEIAKKHNASDEQVAMFASAVQRAIKAQAQARSTKLSEVL